MLDSVKIDDHAENSEFGLPSIGNAPLQVLAATRGLSSAMGYLCNTARKALFALNGRCQLEELHIFFPALQSTLFDALL